VSKRNLGLFVGTSVLSILLAPTIATSLPMSMANADDASRGQLQDTDKGTHKVEQMALPQLQVEAAKLQADFVRASLDLEQARLNLHTARADEVDALAAADRAQTVADDEAEDLASYVGLLYTQGPAMDPDLMLLLTGFGQTESMLRQNLVFEEVTDDQATVVGRAQEAQADADRLHTAALQQKTDADAAEATVQGLLTKISARADEVTAAAESSFTDNTQAALFDDAEQTARNTSATTAWKGYLRSVKAGPVKSPDAHRLDDPTDLPKGTKPLLGGRRNAVPGVAVTDGANPRTVLPKQAVAAVNVGLDALGTPFVAGNAGPETYDCGGLVQAAYPDLDLGATPAAQYEHTTQVPPKTIQVGDLVFFATKGAGIHDVGIYLGGNLMVSADGTASQVAVVALPGEPYAVTRPSLPNGVAHKAPEGDGSQQMSCGVELLPGGASSAGMVYPVKQGSFHFTGTFGDPGTHWATGFHTGLDFAAPVGTPVVAAREGTVSISHPSWAGNLITIDHGDGLTTLYAHLSAVLVRPGQKVLSGQSIGLVGQLGNTTGPHLHFEVGMLGTPVDPMLFLSGFSEDGAAGWGGFLNGMIPRSEMCSLEVASNQLLRCDAAKAFDALATVYKDQFGTDLCITDSYRSFALQVTTFANKPGLAAVPGTSNHGWARAVDLCGGIETAGSPQHAWMQAHAPAFGWVHPAWAEPSGGRPEAWHWEFGNIS
jgi:murein DD-endopeptidase MepM/ murein hydrolase activator NlpD